MRHLRVGADGFSIGGVIGRTRRICFIHPLGFMVLATVVVAVSNWLGPVLLTPQVAELLSAAGDGRFFTGTSVFVALAPRLVSGLLIYAGNLLVVGTVTTAAWRDVEGRPATFGASLRAGIGRFPSLLAISILSYAGILLGTILLVIPGVLLAVTWLVARQVHVIERSGIRDAFVRSRSLTAGHRWPMLGLTLLYIALFAVVFGAVSYGSGLALRYAVGADGVRIVFRSYDVLVVVLTAVFDIVSAAGLAAIYIELRRTKDGHPAHDLVDAFT